MKTLLKTVVVLALCISPYSLKWSASNGLMTTALLASELSQSLESIAEQSGQESNDTIAALAENVPVDREQFRQFFNRDRNSTEEDRRAILLEIQADVPDSEGKFTTPGRQTADDVKKADAFDWLSALEQLDKSKPGAKDVIADVAAIRVLSKSSDWNAGHLILDFVFSPEGLIYRDEGGRRLRNMSPLSLPALIHGSQNRQDASMTRYATYQLERLDRQNSNKAFADTPTEGLKIAVLKAFSDSGYREAVYTVLDQVNHINPKVRKAARESWMEYIDGKPPKSAPKRKLELAGGKTSDQKEPLWLNHRELATVALRRKLKSLTGKSPNKNHGLIKSSQVLFEFYDNERQEDLSNVFKEGTAKLKDGAYKEAALLFDTVLVRDPTFDKRDKMARAYFEAGKEFESEDNFQEASTYYAKSHAVEPTGGLANDALSKHHLMRGKIAEANGDDAAAEFAQAKVVETQTQSNVTAPKSPWIWGGLASLVMALIFLLVGFKKHRRET